MQRIAIITSSRQLRSLSAEVEVAAALSLAGTADNAHASAPARLAVKSHTASAFDWRNWSRVKSHHAQRDASGNPRI